MSLMLIIALLVIIVCFVYLYNNYIKNIPTRNDSEFIGNNWVVLFYAIFGGIFTYLLFSIIQMMFKRTDVQGLIFIATIILSSILCGCTSYIVLTLKNLYATKEDK